MGGGGRKKEGLHVLGERTESLLLGRIISQLEFGGAVGAAGHLTSALLSWCSLPIYYSKGACYIAQGTLKAPAVGISFMLTFLYLSQDGCLSNYNGHTTTAGKSSIFIHAKAAFECLLKVVLVSQSFLCPYSYQKPVYKESSSCGPSPPHVSKKHQVFLRLYSRGGAWNAYSENRWSQRHLFAFS